MGIGSGTTGGGGAMIMLGAIVPFAMAGRIGEGSTLLAFERRKDEIRMSSAGSVIETLRAFAMRTSEMGTGAGTLGCG